MLRLIQSIGRCSDRVKEEGLATDLEDKPLPPPQAPFGGGAGRDVNHDPQDEATAVKTEVTSSNPPPWIDEDEIEIVDDNQIPDPATGDSLTLLNSTTDLGMSTETQDPERAWDPAVGEETVPAVAASSGNPSETGSGPAHPTAVGGKKTPDPAGLQG
ncbi:unnamed protein product [Phytophthora fragariaefolia]|uniref:Unnamed protein product n=1 Tax=Phytophthora fragariaefolia TaxID=1490495 RepID=A0A9W6XCW5_9STRA|nr:unnamed protein product [Phytophthora fragariaefolia]